MAFEFWTDDAHTSALDLTGQTVTFHVDATTFAVGIGVTVLPATGQTVPNRVEVHLTGTQTAALAKPLAHHYIDFDPMGVPVNGTLYTVDP